MIGDVRDYRTLGLFKGRLQLNKMQPSVNVKEFKWAIEQDILKEEELCISPTYFYRLKLIYPTITHVDIQWKKVSFINELSLYRYDVIIYVGINKPLYEIAWQYGLDYRELAKRNHRLSSRQAVRPQFTIQ